MNFFSSETDESRGVYCSTQGSLDFNTQITEAAIQESVNFIIEKIPEKYHEPKVGIICGSGLSNLGARLDEDGVVEISYNDIPNFTPTGVPGHGNSLLIGMMNGVVTICLTGRVHFYEGHSLQTVVFATRVLIALRIKTLLISNAAGGLDESFKVGDVMVINDHISFLNLAGISPLRGANLNSIGPRFPSLSDAYHSKSYMLTMEAAIEANMDHSCIKEGVYVGVGGPTYETPAEMRFMRMIGGSSVGMSTVPEVICAAHAGVAVVALSLITDVPVPRSDNSKVKPTTHEDVMKTAALRAADMEGLVYRLVPKIVNMGNTTGNSDA